jgi:hypothetical protein
MEQQDAVFDLEPVAGKRVQGTRRRAAQHGAIQPELGIVAGADELLPVLFPADTASQVGAFIGEYQEIRIRFFDHKNTITGDRFFPAIDLAAGERSQRWFANLKGFQFPQRDPGVGFDGFERRIDQVCDRRQAPMNVPTAAVVSLMKSRRLI